MKRRKYRLPGPKPKMTYTIKHPITGAKRVYHGVKNRDACHRLAVSWAKKYRKNVRLTILSSNASGVRPVKVTASGKWLTDPKGKKYKKAKKSTKSKGDRRYGRNRRALQVGKLTPVLLYAAYHPVTHKKKVRKTKSGLVSIAREWAKKYDKGVRVEVVSPDRVRFFKISSTGKWTLGWKRGDLDSPRG
jgi:hypothetical protein